MEKKDEAIQKEDEAVQKNEDSESTLSNAISSLAKLIPVLNRWAGKYTHVFAEPFAWQGKTYKRLSFDWEILRGRDCIRIESEARRRGGAPALEANSYPIAYLAGMAAHACTERDENGRMVIGTDALDAMNAQDCLSICRQARLFLAVSAL